MGLTMARIAASGTEICGINDGVVGNGGGIRDVCMYVRVGVANGDDRFVRELITDIYRYALAGVLRELIDGDLVTKSGNPGSGELRVIAVDDEGATRKIVGCGCGRCGRDALCRRREIDPILGFAGANGPHEWYTVLQEVIYQTVGFQIERGNQRLVGIVHRDYQRPVRDRSEICSRVG